MSHGRRLVLASTSPYRAGLLRRLGLPFESQAPDCDEDAWKDRGLAPDQLACELARAKAESIHRRCAEDWVLGGDQVCSLEGEILGKPGDPARAREMLRRLQGREHWLFTAVCLVGPAGAHEHLDRTGLCMRSLPDEAVSRYVAADRPLDCAGAYKLESRGIALFERIESEDHTAVTGMPLIAVTRMLVAAGFDVP